MPRNCRASCSVSANPACSASLGTDRICVYSALIVKHQKLKKKKRAKWVVWKSPERCEWRWLVLRACGAVDFSPPCGQMAPGQGARGASPSRADTCTNFEALAVRPCKHRPENLQNDDSFGMLIVFNQPGFIPS